MVPFSTNRRHFNIIFRLIQGDGKGHSGMVFKGGGDKMRSQAELGMGWHAKHAEGFPSKKVKNKEIRFSRNSAIRLKLNLG